MKFKVSYHAQYRFNERVSSSLNIYDVLNKAKLCDEYESMDIDADYTKFTGTRKVINNKNAYFKYKDVIFACVKTNIKEYLVQTCWVKPKFESESIFDEEMQNTMIEIIKYLRSRKTFYMSNVLKIIHGKQFHKDLKKFIKNNPYITKWQFIQYLDNNPLYKEVSDDYIKTHHKQYGMRSLSNCGSA